MRKAAILTFALGALLLWGRADAADPPQQSGRYQVFFSPHVRADTFLVDTQTGTVWQLMQYSVLNGDPMAWNMMTRLDSPTDWAAFSAFYGTKPVAAKPAAKKAPN